MNKKINLLIIFFVILLVSLLNSFANQFDTLHWKKVFSKPANDLYDYWYSRSLLCSDSLNCAAFMDLGGTGARVIVTSDGGFTWNIILDEGFMYENICTQSFLNKDSIFVVTQDDSIILRTTNGGLVWSSINSHLNINNISFLKNGTGLCEIFISDSQPSLILNSSDFGLSWKFLPSSPPVEYFYLLHIFSDQVYGCFGQDNEVIIKDSIYIHHYYYLKTEDGGLTWIKYPFSNLTRSYYFLDTLKGWATCNKDYQGILSYDVIKYTSNGGKTWSEQLDTLLFPINEGLSSVSFIDSIKGVAIGAGGKIIFSKDGGNHWIYDTTAPFWNDTSFETFGGSYVQYITSKRVLVLTYYGCNIYLYDEDGFPDIVKETVYENQGISISPNPTYNNCIIKVNFGEPCQIQLELFNVLGLRVLPAINEYVDAGTYTKQFDLSSLAPGVYFVVINTGKERLVQKFVKIE